MRRYEIGRILRITNAQVFSLSLDDIKKLIFHDFTQNPK